MRSSSFERFAGFCAIGTGLGGFVYSVAFVLIARVAPDFGSNLSWLLLMLGGLLSTPVLIALYLRLQTTDQAFALLALLLGVVGALGSAVHGGYGLANAIHPPEGGLPSLPSQVDPRGLLTFGVTGIALLVFAWLVGRSPRFPKGLSYLGLTAAVLLLLIYLARLIILTSTNALVLVPAVLSGFLISPAWFIRLGLVLLRDRSDSD